MQLSLLGRGQAPTPVDLGRVRRFDLGAGAWVDHLPGWITGHEALFHELLGACAWKHERRPMYDRIVDVPRLVARAPPSCPSLARLGAALSLRYRLRLSEVWLNLYRNGEDSVAYHGDKMGALTDDTIVAIVSVGAPRRFLMRPLAGGEGRAFKLGWGDLLVMGGSCQKTWLHGVPKVAHADPRISIMFRPLIRQVSRDPRTAWSAS